MKGQGQHTNQETELKSAEDYRATADEHAQTLKDFWKRFMVSGLFVVAAIVIILACLAWFLNNSQVNAGGLNVSAAGAKLALVADSGSSSQPAGYYERTDTEKDKLRFDTSNAMTVTLNSNLNNETAGTLYPGARGQIKFKVQPLTNDLNGATISISRVLQNKNGDLIKEGDYDQQNLPELLKLAKGHLLLFTSCSDAGFYSNWVTDSIVIPKSEFCEEGSDETTKSVDVTLSWVWPEYIQDLVYTGNGNYRKNLFASANADYAAMQEYVNSNKSYFYYDGGKDVSGVPKLESGMRSTPLAQCADYYNKADDYLGNNVAYFQLQLSADETPRKAS